MAIEKDVRVPGKLDMVWGKLLSTLSMNGYTIKSQVQNVQITAEKGSRLVSSMVGGTKGGYRTAEISLGPVDNKVLVKFKFTFSALGAGTAWGGAKDEIEKMIGEFEHECSKDVPPAQTAPLAVPTGGSSCPSCHKSVSADFAMCPYCGSKLGKSTCSNCHKEIGPDFKMCPYCGTPR